MLSEISKEVDAQLVTRKVPLRVVYGPERAPSNTSERIVIEHDRRAGDSFEMAGITSNPKSCSVRWQGAVARIFAQETFPGARIQDHERRASAVLDRVIVALNVVVKGRKNQWRAEGGTFVAPKDIEGSETWPGAVYEFRFAVDRGIVDSKWDGEIRPEHQLGASGFLNQTIVKLASDDAEIACDTLP
jgi:hypothetical protein